MVRSMNRKKCGIRTEVRFSGMVIFLFLILSSCIDDPPTHPEVSDYQSYLDMVWDLYDQKYVSFDVKNVDWDAVHDLYSQMISGVNSNTELRELISQMIGTLEDKNAFFEDFDPFAYPHYFPTYSPDIEINYVDSVLLELLEPWGFEWHTTMGDYWGNCVIDSIPYFAIKHFDYFFTFYNFSSEVQNHLDAPGMIIDIRMSNGVSLVPAEQIPGIFTQQPLTAFLTQYRTGPGHDDLSALVLHDVSPRVWGYTEPIVLLVGEQNFGASEAFTSVMSQMPYLTIIGDTTGGGGNIPGYFYQRYWPLWDDWNITCPFARVFTADTVSIEGIGILPDIYVQTTPADFLAGNDPVLEYAIEWIAEETAP